MRVADLSPVLLHVVGVALGVVGGLVAAALADWLPRRYDIVDLVTGAKRRRRNLVVTALLVAIGLGLAHVVSGHPNATAGQAGIYLAAHFVLSTIAVAAAAIDVEHMILPNELTIGGAAIALATAPLRPLGLQASAIGAVLGLVIAWLPSVAYKKLRGKSGQGLGDAKLAILAGAWHGFLGAFFVLLAGALQMALTAFAMKALGIGYPIPDSVKRDIEDLRAKAAAGDAEAKQLLEDDPIANEDAGGGLLTTGLPLGPFLVLALLELVFAGGPIFSAFDRLLAPG